MLATIKQYHDFLLSLQSEPTSLIPAIQFQTKEKIYNVDLNSRKIEAPEFLSVETDHRSEIIYFQFDRFFDNMDLTNTTCIIEYYNKTAQNNKQLLASKAISPGIYIYKVPFYDIETLAKDNKIIIPWVIEGPATIAAGEVVFSIRFYIANEQQFSFILNTQPAMSKVLHGMEDILRENKKYDIDSTVLEQVWQNIEINNKMLEEKLQDVSIMWIDV